MTEPLRPPPKKDPQRVTRPPQLPPLERSSAALAMSAAAARGVFALQVCETCGTVCYPPRDACPTCLSVALAFRPVEDGGEVIAETTIRTTTDLYFRERTPWRVGTVRLDHGPTVLAHLHGEVAARSRVRLAAKLDKSGNAVLIALPPTGTATMADDPQLRELTASPKFRRALVTDARTAVGQAVVHALSKAGASLVFAGVAEPWKPFSGMNELRERADIRIVPLDLTDTHSVEELTGEIGGKVDILVNTADFVRAGGIMASSGVATAREAFDVNVLGLQRLARSFGPAMLARGADGIGSAAAWVDILPVYALGNLPEFGFYSASAAARLSVLQCLRSELRPGGVRVLCVFTGPVEDEWRQDVPPPKVTPAQIARAVVTALEQGIEDSFVGDVARDVAARFRADPKVLERELAR